MRLKGVAVSAGGARGVWQRHNLLTKHERLLRLEKAAAERKIELQEGQIRLLERFSPEFRERHIEASQPGSLVAVDTFFVGVLNVRMLISAIGRDYRSRANARYGRQIANGRYLDFLARRTTLCAHSKKGAPHANFIRT